MKDGTSKSFEQAYNCQAVVDDKSQIIVATNVTQQSNDKQQVEPMVETIKENTGGEIPKKLSVDTGYFSESNIEYLEGEEIDVYVATGNTSTAVHQCRHHVGVFQRISLRKSVWLANCELRRAARLTRNADNVGHFSHIVLGR